ncbi:MAG: tyrosinase family protein [Desulfobacterales bacterium]|nr:tyrosinase family protein [Desulfobacterales bacterium]
MKCRKSVAAMIAANEQGAFIQAVIDLKNTRPSIIAQAQADGAQNRYDDYVWMHKAAFSLIHLGPAFGPWHREILRQFELDLRDVSGNPNIYIPYWDWPTARQPNDPGWPFINDLMGGLGTGANNAVEAGPFAGSTGNWDINVKDVGDTHTVLRRVSSTNPTSQSLPDDTDVRDSLGAQPYDSNPYNDNNFPSNAQASASFRKSLEFFLHNGPHNWVGNQNNTLFLDMMARSSPNDPIFFLHHAQVDRMWSLWQDKYPNLNHFEPVSGANSGHNLNEVMDLMDVSYFNFPVLATNAANVDLHATGVWYDTDLPEVALATPSVNFGTIPAGLTTYFPVQFTVEGCRAMRFRITGIAGSGFSIPPGNAIVDVPATDDPSPRTIDVFVRCIAPADGSPVGPGSVSIEALIIDNEGYLAATVGGEHVFDTFMATLSATVVPRPTSAVAFVSDRSGSMSGTAGGGFTKFQLLEEALEVATDLLETTDSAALVFFDHAVSTPLSMSAIGGGSGVNTALSNPAIQPNFGSTAIGEGLISGAAELNSYVPPSGVTNPNLAILCLTDGNENVTPWVTSATVMNAISAYSSDLYAIGLGTEDNVSAGTLGAISQYMLITGDKTADQRRFMVTKYFVQILADIKKANIVVDPDGILHIGVTHEVHFDLSEADVEAEVILLSPAAPYIELEVVTPGGDILSQAALGPNAKLEVNRLDAILRLSLPALPGSPHTSHAGRWTLRLRLAKKSLRHLRERMVSMVFAGRVPAIEYSVVVQTRSNLTFEVGRTFPLIAPGDVIPLEAALTQYRMPLTSAVVTAQVTDPQGHTRRHQLTLDATGRFVADISAQSRGVHTCRVMASGHTLGGMRFMRETTRTFAVGDPSAKPSTENSRDNRTGALCLLLECVLHDSGIRKWMEANGVDLERLRKCLAATCAPPREGDARGLDLKTHLKAIKDLSSDELAKFVKFAIKEQESADPLVAPKPRPLYVPEVDPAFLEAPMFMPALARTKDGNIILATTGKAPPPRGDASIEVSLLKGISREGASALAEAGIYTAGDLLARPQELRRILGLPMASIKKILDAARSGDVKGPAKKKTTTKKTTKKMKPGN